MIFFKSERFLEEMYCKRTKVWSGNLVFLDLKIKKVGTQVTQRELLTYK